MKGDFSRDTFRSDRHYSGVLMQQGRVQLDADWNEQLSIFLHHLRSTTADIVGWHGSPTADGFKVGVDNTGDTLVIGDGRYYVDGILCENGHDCTVETQPDHPTPDEDPKKFESLIVFLDVWERHVTVIESPALIEVALGDADTTTRRQVVWQVRAKELDDPLEPAHYENQEALREALGLRLPKAAGTLAARLEQTPDLGDPCIESPDSAYRGPENQLYRVEIHDGSPDLTYKWSRENGSVAVPIRECRGNSVIVAHLDHDNRYSLKEGDLVEVLDDDDVRAQRTGILTMVTGVDPMDFKVDLRDQVTCTEDTYPLLRKWDGYGRIGDGTPAAPGGAYQQGKSLAKSGSWVELEDGIEVKFDDGEYKTGDYWLIPARATTGSIEWPTTSSNPAQLPPFGIHHHYAPLAWWDEYGKFVELRCCFEQLAKPCP